MSPIANPGLQAFQAGPESTAGTAVAATTRLAVEELTFTPDDLVVRPRIANGVMLDNPGNELVTMRATTFTARGPVVYDEMHRWASMVIAADAPTGVGPYVHTFTRNPLAVPVLKSWTLERRISDGTNFIDNEWAYSLGRSLRISGATNEPLRFEVAGFSRRVQSSTLTAAQALPTVEIPPIALSKVYIDTTYAGIGGTQIVAQVLNWSATYRSGAQPVMTADARTDLDYTLHTINGREAGVDIEMLLLIKADSGQYATEKTAAEAQSLRAVQIQADGTSSKNVTVKALAKHVAGSLFQVDEQDGMAVVTLRLISTSDLTNAFGLIVTNAAATI